MKSVATRRSFLKQSVSTAIAAYATAHVISAKEALAHRLVSAGSIPSVGLTAITIARTGTKYALLRQAIAAAISGDTIQIPAGTYAPDYPQYPYAYWDHYWTSSNVSSGYGFMYISFPLTFTAVGAANNGRAKWEMPYVTLTADVPANTAAPWTAQVVSTASLTGYVAAGDLSGALYYSLLNPGAAAAWDSGAGAPVSASGIGWSSMTSTTLSMVNNSPPVDMPAGTILRMGVYSGQGFIVPVASNPGIVLNNIEILDTLGGYAGDPVHNTNATPIYQLQDTGFASDPTSTGSVTANNCYFHHCAMGPRGSGCALGSGAFIHLFNTELYENGFSVVLPGVTHNIYVPEVDEFILDNCYSHHTMGVHLVKDRARSSFITYSRITGERTDQSNTVASCNIDVSNGGLTYIIGCQFEQETYITNFLINYCAEGAINPIQELYVVNNTCVGTPLGGEYSYNTGFLQATPPWTPVAISNFGVGAPGNPTIQQTAGGSLSQTNYAAALSLVDATGAETGSSSSAALTVSANNLLKIISPIFRTGAIGWNSYASYADPVMYFTGAYPIPDATCCFFYDAGFTQPAITEASSGSLPSRALAIGITYLFGSTESVNAGTSAASPYYNPASWIIYTTTANDQVTIKSPPSVPGATGWNIYASNGQHQYSALNGQVGANNSFTKQNASPIAIGTDWTEPSTGMVYTAGQMVQNWYRQNSSPIALATNWTESTSGLANNNPVRLKWFCRIFSSNYGQTTIWYAQAPAQLTNYVATLYGANNSATAFSISGVTGFDSNASFPQEAPSTGTFSTTGTDTIVLAIAENGGVWGTPPAGWTALPGASTQIYYKTFSSPQSGVSIGAANQPMFLDALTGSAPAIDGTPVGMVGIADHVAQLTISNANAGDFIIVVANTYYALIGIDSTLPIFSSSVSGSPIGYVDNNIAEYFCNSSGTDNGWINQTGFLTVGSHNVQTNYSTNVSFTTPSYNTPVPGFNNQSNYDYNLVLGSVAIGAGTNPGSSPESYSLVPAYQISYVGLPSPGTPILALVARPNTGGVFDAGAFEYGI